MQEFTVVTFLSYILGWHDSDSYWMTHLLFKYTDWLFSLYFFFFSFKLLYFLCIGSWLTVYIQTQLPKYEEKRRVQSSPVQFRKDIDSSVSSARCSIPSIHNLTCVWISIVFVWLDLTRLKSNWSDPLSQAKPSHPRNLESQSESKWLDWLYLRYLGSFRLFIDLSTLACLGQSWRLRVSSIWSWVRGYQSGIGDLILTSIFQAHIYLGISYRLRYHLPFLLLNCGGLCFALIT